MRGVLAAWALLPLLLACTADVPTSALGPAAPPTREDEDTARATFIPLPALSLSQTRGKTIGILPLLLVRDEEGGVATIIAPSITYNEFRRLSGWLRLYRFFGDGGSARVIAGLSQRNDFRITSEFEDPEFFSRRLGFSASASIQERGRERFYGVGPRSTREGETNYSHRSAELHASAVYRLGDPYELELGFWLSQDRARSGIVPAVPETAAEYPELSELPGHRAAGPRGALRYDSRDDEDRPTSGTLAAIDAELAFRPLGGGSSFTRLGAELRGYAAHGGEAVVSAGRLRAEQSVAFAGGRLPWLELGRLGGPDTLRGFARDRFADAAVVIASYEARVAILRTRIAETRFRGEFAPFVDAGQVAQSLGALRVRDMRVSAGAGLRGTVGRGITGRADVAISEEEFNLRLALDYPF